MEHIHQIGIIGAGEIGKAIGEALSGTHVQVLYFDKEPARSTTASLEDVVRSCPVLLLCVPSWALEDVTRQVSRVARPTEPRLVISLAKGVEPGLVTVDQVLEKRLPKYYHYGVLFGPMIAEELARGHAAYGVLAMNDMGHFTALRELLAPARIYIEANGDMRSVALCAILKNVYAIAFGMCDGLRLGLNAKGKLAVIILAEMKRLIGELGGDPRTAEGAAGLGDLLSTGFSSESFNYRIGKTLAEGIVDPHVRSEGLLTLQQLGKLKALKLARYPVLHALDQAAFHYAKPTIIAEILV